MDDEKKLDDIEEKKRLFEFKNEYISNLAYQEFNIEYSQIYLEDFLDIVFHRNINGKDVEPFEEEMCDEYRDWVKQKQERKEEIDYSRCKHRKYNGIIFYKDAGRNRHRLMLAEDEKTYEFLDRRQFAIMSPVTYVGKTNTKTNARYLYAFAVDLDGVGENQIRDIFFQMSERSRHSPIPNIIVNSGNGLHLYFLLENPVPLYKENYDKLNHIKEQLTNVVWNWASSNLDTRQYQSVFQAFRLPGTLTKFGEVITAWHNREAPMYDLATLNSYAARPLKAKELAQIYTRKYNPTSITLEEAKRLYPEWYENRVKKKKSIGKKWHTHPAVYEWWLNLLRNADKETIKVHHRYWCIFCLVCYGVKCDVPLEQVREDALSLVAKLDALSVSADNRFTEQDVEDALKAYDVESARMSKRAAEKLTAIRMPPPVRRNGRKQEDHLKLARFARDLAHDDWREGCGRKPMSGMVALWRAAHPFGNKSECAKDLGISRPTVAKWWDIELPKKEEKKAEVERDEKLSADFYEE